eukprot:68905-Rhodomonas_salina.1
MPARLAARAKTAPHPGCMPVRARREAPGPSTAWKQLQWADLDTLALPPGTTVVLQHSKLRRFTGQTSARSPLSVTLQNLMRTGRACGNHKIAGFVKTCEFTRLRLSSAPNAAEVPLVKLLLARSARGTAPAPPPPPVAPVPHDAAAQQQPLESAQQQPLESAQQQQPLESAQQQQPLESAQQQPLECAQQQQQHPEGAQQQPDRSVPAQHTQDSVLHV